MYHITVIISDQIYCKSFTVNFFPKIMHKIQSAFNKVRRNQAVIVNGNHRKNPAFAISKYFLYNAELPLPSYSQSKSKTNVVVDNINLNFKFLQLISKSKCFIVCRILFSLIIILFSLL